MAGKPYRDLLIDTWCTVDVHDPHVPDYPGLDISHELSDVVKRADEGECPINN